MKLTFYFFKEEANDCALLTLNLCTYYLLHLKKTHVQYTLAHILKSDFEGQHMFCKQTRNNNNTLALPHPSTLLLSLLAHK